MKLSSASLHTVRAAVALLSSRQDIVATQPPGVTASALWVVPDAQQEAFSTTLVAGQSINLKWAGGIANVSTGDLWVAAFAYDATNNFAQLLTKRANLTADGAFSWNVSIPEPQLNATPHYVLTFKTPRADFQFDAADPGYPSPGLSVVSRDFADDDSSTTSADGPSLSTAATAGIATAASASVIGAALLGWFWARRRRTRMQRPGDSEQRGSQGPGQGPDKPLPQRPFLVLQTGRDGPLMSQASSSTPPTAHSAAVEAESVPIALYAPAPLPPPVGDGARSQLPEAMPPRPARPPRPDAVFEVDGEDSYRYGYSRPVELESSQLGRSQLEGSQLGSSQLGRSQLESTRWESSRWESSRQENGTLDKEREAGFI